MPHRKLPNYVRASRKRAGFSQEELAFLLGCESGTKVSRYEMFRREPKLSTVFALEVILGRPARELFAGVFDEAEHQTVLRAQRLIRRLRACGDSVQARRKLAVLESVAREMNGGHGTEPK